VTVNGSDGPAITAEPEQQNEIKRSTILNAPTKDDRADTLLPLIPGVVRGPDGLINLKGARSSQAGALVNSASVVDPVTGNPAMSLPIDVVEAVTVIANPTILNMARLLARSQKPRRPPATSRTSISRYRTCFHGRASAKAILLDWKQQLLAPR
jgi:hypothetical protein